MVDTQVERFVALMEQAADDTIEGELVDEAYDDYGAGDLPVGLNEAGATLHYVNEAGVPEAVIDDLKGNRDIASAIERWSRSLAEEANSSVSSDMFNRSQWEGAKHIHAQMGMVAWAVENDDILSGTADVLEGLMWQKCRFELFDEQQQDMWNQWAETFDLDTQLRKFGREIYKVSQVYIGLLWEDKVYKVRDSPIQDTIQEYENQVKQREYDDAVEQRDALIAANANNPAFIEPPEIPEVPEKKRGRGNHGSKKKFAVRVPTEMTIFDPTKIVPVGTFMFGRERFAYVADVGEEQSFTQVMQGGIADPLVRQLVERKYVPTASERARLQNIGVAPERLWLMRQDAVFRHTLTRADYEPYPVIRLKSVLPILEMKQHLRAADRAALIGNTNFIVVVTKGTDKLPAKAAEIDNLKEQVRVIARLPVLVGDHRLNVQIIAPAQDHTLTQARWETLDARLIYKALGTYAPVVQGGNASGTGVSEMSRVIASGLEGRRHMIKRSLEKSIFRKVLEINDRVLSEMPSLTFVPKRITLDFNADVITQILKLRDRGDISRESTLEEVGFDQEVEVQRRAREKAEFDPTFASSTPHSSPLANPYGQPPPPTLPPAGGGGAPPASNVGPAGQPRTEGGRPRGVAETKPRAKRGAAKEAASLEKAESED